MTGNCIRRSMLEDVLGMTKNCSQRTSSGSQPSLQGTCRLDARCRRARSRSSRRARTSPSVATGTTIRRRVRSLFRRTRKRVGVAGRQSWKPARGSTRHRRGTVRCVLRPRKSGSINRRRRPVRRHRPVRRRRQCRDRRRRCRRRGLAFPASTRDGTRGRPHR